MFNWLPKNKKLSQSNRGIYGYPNDNANTIAIALNDIWSLYLANSENGIEIDVQGMGATVEQYKVDTAVLKNGKLSWKLNSKVMEVNSELTLQSAEELVAGFPAWASKRITKFEDTNDFCLAVYLRKEHE
jgi:hypothetical protein